MAATILKPMDDLPHTPASDVKKLGWRGVMRVVARSGKVVVTNHGRPEAVVLSSADYAALLADAEIGRSKRRDELDALRQQFDERLRRLREPGAGDRFDALFDEPLDLGGRIIAGQSF